LPPRHVHAVGVDVSRGSHGCLLQVHEPISGSGRRP
jgi:hypothetical protein